MAPFMVPFPSLKKYYQLHEGMGDFDASLGDVGLPEV